MKYKIELKKLTEGRGSEETTNFYADVYIDGKLVATAENTGKGGETDVRAAGKTMEQYSANNTILNEVRSYFRLLPKVKPEGYTFEMQPSLVNHVDELVHEALTAKDKIRFKNRQDKSCLKGICFGNNSEYRIIDWKGKTLAEVIANPHNEQVIINVISKAKASLKPGDKIFNTNLGQYQKYV